MKTQSSKCQFVRFFFRLRRNERDGKKKREDYKLSKSVNVYMHIDQNMCVIDTMYMYKHVLITLQCVPVIVI